MKFLIFFCWGLIFFWTLLTSARSQTIETTLIKTILIDPGHGGSSNAGTDAAKNKSTANNATSATRGIKEKDVTLALSKLIASKINTSEAATSGKVRAVLTRDTDVNLDFSKRVEIAASSNAACFVAIHFNADPSQRVSGPRAIIQQATKNLNDAADRKFGLSLAKSVEVASKKFRPKTPAASLHDDHELHDGWGSYLFYQLNQNEKTKLIPACHLEVEFLDNKELEMMFFVDRKDDVFAAWADAIAKELTNQVLAAE